MASTGPRAQQTHVTTPSSPSTRVVPSTAVLREDNPRGLKPSALCVSRHLGAVALVGSLVLPTGCSQHLPGAARDAAKQFMVGAFLGDKDVGRRHDEFVRTSGIRPRLLMTFVPWPQNGSGPFPVNFCRLARERGATPLITWEPWDPSTQWHASLADIAAGREDRRLEEWAGAARRWKSPVMLRFAHEMNGDWYPWCERQEPSQTAAHYVAAWKHMRDVFRRARADNVEFIWAPNFEPAEHIARVYPGAKEVDWIGIDLYNHPGWPRDPAVLLAPLLGFAEKVGKKVILTEVGCAEEYLPEAPTIESAEWTSKPKWISRLFEVIASRPAIRGLVWFDIRKEADWRIDSSPAALSAFRQGLLSLDSQDVMKR